MARIELNEIAHSYISNPKDESDFNLRYNKEVFAHKYLLLLMKPHFRAAIKHIFSFLNYDIEYHLYKHRIILSANSDP